MKYVLDASVALKWMIDEPNVARARLLREEFENFSVELIAPDLFQIEIAHVLSKAYRGHPLSAEEADAYLNDLMTTPPVFIANKRLLPRAFEISMATRTGVYDAVYMALGELEHVPVITADQRIANIPQAQRPCEVILIENLPLPPSDPRRTPR